MKTPGDELKEQAAAAESAASKATEGGQVPRDSVAAGLQSVADRVKDAEEKE